MSEQTNPVISYSVAELFQQIQGEIRSLSALVAGSQNRMAALEQQGVACAALEAELRKLEKTFLGFESRFHLHEQAASHPSATAQMATLILDVEQLKAERATRSKLDDYIRGQEEQRDADNRWRVGLLVGGLFQTAMLMLALGKAFGWVP